MKKAAIFIVIAVVLIWGGIALNKRLDKEAEEAGIISEKQAEEELAMNLPDLRVEDMVVGTGSEAKSGNEVVVHYLGTLPDGKKFDSSYDRKQPFTMRLGEGKVIQGWELGLLGMKVGGKRRLTIPPELGYGEVGAGDGLIPPNATLIFEVELLEVR